MQKLTVLSALILWCHSQLVLANNNLFLPGDAFFPTVLTGSDVAKLKANPRDPPTFYLPFRTPEFHFPRISDGDRIIFRRSLV